MKWLLLIFAFFPVAASAQTVEQRVGSQLGQLMLQNTALQYQLEQLQAQLKEAKKCEGKANEADPPK